MNFQPADNALWIIKAIVKQQDTACEMVDWNNMVVKFETKRVHDHIKVSFSKVDWRHLFYRTLARHRALYVFWLACHNRLATKERTKRFGMLGDDCCNFCSHIETTKHIFFACPHVNIICKQVLTVDEYSTYLCWVDR